MLECSHDASRWHATMFFNYSFHFRVIQEIFDSHDGLRKIFNVVWFIYLFQVKLVK